MIELDNPLSEDKLDQAWETEISERIRAVEDGRTEGIPYDRNRPAAPYGTGSGSGGLTGRAKGLDWTIGEIQPLALGDGLLGAKVSFQPLGVSCQMSLLG